MYLHARLLALTEGVRLRIFFAAAMGILAAAAGIARLAVAGVVILKVVRDEAAFSTLVVPLLVMAALIVLRAGLQYLQDMISHHTASIVKVQLRKRLYEHSLALGPGYFDQSRTGDVLLSLADGVEKLEAFFGQYLPQMIVAAVAPLLIFAFMAVLDLQIGLIFLGFALMTLFVPNLLHRWTKDSSMSRRQTYGELGADFLDAVQGLGTLKAFGQSRARGQLLGQRARRLYHTTMGVLAANMATSSITILGISGGAALALGWGAFRVSNGDVELRSLLIVLMLGVEIFRPLRELVQLYHEGMIAMSSADGIFAIMDTSPEIVDPAANGDIAGIKSQIPEKSSHPPFEKAEGISAQRPQEDIQGSNDLALVPEITFDQVEFAYDRGRRPALRQVSFSLAAGETLGLVGPSGAGKSTVVWLILRFYDPQQGRVLLGGHDLRDLPLELLRQQIAVVTQDTYLFHGTVADNLRFGKPDASQHELEDAARAANAHEFIAELPQGYDTVVGERAVRLSGGQRQRIAIARALLKDAPILVLDEAMSSVDAENEDVIQQALDRLMRDRTTLVIAHRLSSVVNADRILVLEDGRVAESGNHRELVAAGGAYARLMAQQQDSADHLWLEDSPRASSGGEAGGESEPTTDARHHAEDGEATAGAAISFGDGHHHEVEAHLHQGPSGSLEGDDGRGTMAPAASIGIFTVWARLLQLVRPWWGQLALTFTMGLLHHGSVIGLGVIGALLVGQVITGGGLTVLLVLLGVFVPIVAFFTWAESWMAHDLAYRLLAEMRIDMYNKLDPLAPAYLVRRRSGDLISIVGGDVETVEYFFAHTITPFFVAVLVPAGVIATLAVISWPVALVLAPFLLSVAISPFYAQRRSERLGEDLRSQLGDVHAHMVDSIQGLREVSAFGRGPDRTAEMVRNGWRFAHTQFRLLKERALQIGFIESMTALGGLAVLTTGIWFKIQGDISRPQLILAVILSIAAFAPISEIARTVKQLMETLAASRRVFAVHDEPVPVKDGRGVALGGNGAGSTAPAITFEAVDFSYGPGEPQALQTVAFTVEPGHTVAMVGRSGAGKTTCANLLMRFWDPSDGRIMLGGHDLRDFGLDQLRQQIALVTQDTYLFNSSIQDNLRLGRQDASDADVEEAARQANAHEFITSFPDGYNTLVGERGMQLSGGQRQRVSIARALLKNSPVLVLDEATSHLDAVNEQQVRQALERLMEGRTTLVIAHRLSTIRDADQIVVLDHGQLVEQGTHQELLAHPGLYAQLVSTQLVSATSGPSYGDAGQHTSHLHDATLPDTGVHRDHHH